MNTRAKQSAAAKRFIISLLELGGQLRVDPDSGMIAYADTPTSPIVVNVEKGVKKHLVVYDSNNTRNDVLMVNPFVETVGEPSIDRKWFYTIINKIHTTAFSRIMESIMDNAIRAANNEKIEDTNMLSTLAALVGSVDVKSSKEIAAIVKKLPEYEGEFDPKMLDECSTVLDSSTNTRDYISLVRRIKEKRTLLLCFLQDEDNEFRKQFGTRVRKKTFTMIENIFRILYGVDDLGEPLIACISDSKTCPSFDSYVRTLLESWNRFIPYLQYIYDDDLVNDTVAIINQLESFLPHMEDMARAVSWARVSTKNGTSENGDLLVDETAEKSKRGRPKQGHYNNGPNDISVSAAEVTKALKDLPTDATDKIANVLNTFSDKMEKILTENHLATKKVEKVEKGRYSTRDSLSVLEDTCDLVSSLSALDRGSSRYGSRSGSTLDILERQEQEDFARGRDRRYDNYRRDDRSYGRDRYSRDDHHRGYGSRDRDYRGYRRDDRYDDRSRRYSRGSRQL